MGKVMKNKEIVKLIYGKFLWHKCKVAMELWLQEDDKKINEVPSTIIGSPDV